MGWCNKPVALVCCCFRVVCVCRSWAPALTWNRDRDDLRPHTCASLLICQGLVTFFTYRSLLSVFRLLLFYFKCKARWFQAKCKFQDFTHEGSLPWEQLVLGCGEACATSLDQNWMCDWSINTCVSWRRACGCREEIAEWNSVVSRAHEAPFGL